jgi:hypothetical protein
MRRRCTEDAQKMHRQPRKRGMVGDGKERRN